MLKAKKIYDTIISMKKYYTYDEITEDMCIDMINWAYVNAIEECSEITDEITNKSKIELSITLEKFKNNLLQDTHQIGNTYKVIDKYPNSVFRIGEILYSKNNNDWYSVLNDTEEVGRYIHINYIINCPTIFKPYQL